MLWCARNPSFESCQVNPCSRAVVSPDLIRILTNVEVSQKLGVPFLGVPIIRTTIYLSLYWGPLILGNYHVEIFKHWEGPYFLGLPIFRITLFYGGIYVTNYSALRGIGSCVRLWEHTPYDKTQKTEV